MASRLESGLVTAFIFTLVLRCVHSTEFNASRSKRDIHKELLSTLFSDYDPLVLPRPDGEEIDRPVNIRLQLSLFYMTDFSFREQTVNMFVGVFVMWKDPGLSWDDRVFPLERIHVRPASMIWRPELCVYESLLSPERLMKVELSVQVKKDGQVLWIPFDYIPLHCSMDIRLYPFDTQVCTLSIGPSVTSNNEKDFNGTSASYRSHIQQHQEWEILSVDVQRYADSGRWVYTYSITMKRKWLFYALNVLLPVLLVSALNSVVFALPAECGEKMSVSLTTFLTLAVFMTLIQDSLPRNSDTVCYLVLYLATQMVLGVVAVILSAVSVTCHQSTSSAMASYLSDGSGRAQNKNSTDDDTKTADSCEAKTETANAQRKRVHWKRVGVVMDKICFPLFITLNIASFVLYICLVAV